MINGKIDVNEVDNERYLDLDSKIHTGDHASFRNKYNWNKEYWNLYEIIEPLSIENGRELYEIFRSDIEKVKLIWVRGNCSISESKRNFSDLKNDENYYDWMFEEAINRGRMNIMYKKNSTYFIEKSKIFPFDEFIFTNDANNGTLTLSKFCNSQPS